MLPCFAVMLLPVLASTVAVMLWRTSVLRTLDALGLPLSVATIGITVGVNVPLNCRFAGWSPEALPQDWQDYADHWNVAHSARTATAVAAFLFAIFAAR